MMNPPELPIRDAGTRVNDGALPSCFWKGEATVQTFPYIRAESYQSHSIPPIRGAHAVTGGPKFSPSPLSTPEKASILKWKYEAPEISEVRGPFERKVLMHLNYFGPL